jgi:hypothetical protein
MIQPNMTHRLWTELRSRIWGPLGLSWRDIEDPQDPQLFQLKLQQTLVFDPVDDQIVLQVEQDWEREFDIW